MHVCHGARLLPQAVKPLSGSIVETVHELCPILTEKADHKDSLGFHLDLETEARLRGVYHLTSEVPSTSAPSIGLKEQPTTLRDLLIDSNSNGSSFILSTRIAFSVILTSWVQQLHMSGWIRDSWSKEDIILVKENAMDDTKALNGFSPYLICAFTPEG